MSFPLGASPDDSAIRQPNSSARSVSWEDGCSNVCLNVSCQKHSVKPNSLGQVRVNWITTDIMRPTTRSKTIHNHVHSVQRQVSCHRHSIKPNSLGQVRVDYIPEVGKLAGNAVTERSARVLLRTMIMSFPALFLHKQGK